MSARRTRRELLAAGAASGGALLAAPGAVATAAGVSAAARRSDAGWLERLMSVELLALYSYDHVLSGRMATPASRPALTELRDHERAHVRALRAALTARGGRPAPPPPSVAAADRRLARRRVSGRLGQLRGPRDALHLLLALERVTVGAYFVALIKLHEPALSQLAAQIMANDAQHEAILGEQLHPGDIPDAIPYGLVQGIQ